VFFVYFFMVGNYNNRDSRPRPRRNNNFRRGNGQGRGVLRYRDGDRSKKLFVVIDFPDDVKRELARVQNDLKNKKILLGDYVVRDTFNLPLKSLGDVDYERYVLVRSRLKNMETGEVSCVLGDLNYSSKGRKVGARFKEFVKSVWVGISGKGLYGLQKNIEEVLGDMVKFDESFKGQLSLVRVISTVDINLFKNKLKELNVKKMDFDVKNFHLMEGHKASEGFVYSSLDEFEI